MAKYNCKRHNMYKQLYSLHHVSFTEVKTIFSYEKHDVGQILRHLVQNYDIS